MAENRTTFLGVSSAEAESSDEFVLSVVTDGDEFRRMGSSRRDMLYCSLEAKLPDLVDLEVVDSLRFDRGVEGPPVDVRVESDAKESVGVRGIDEERVGSKDVAGFFKEDRAGGGGS